MQSGEVIKCGLVVWSTGVSPTGLVTALSKQGWQTDKRSGRLLIDAYLRVMSPVKNIFALGDCAVAAERMLPPTAQVAI